MGRKKGKKRSDPEPSRAIPGLTSIPSSSRDQPPASAGSAAAGGSRQGTREQASVSQQPEQSGSGQSREQPPAPEGRRPGTREQASVPTQLPKPQQPGSSDPGKPDVPGRSGPHADPCSSGEQSPSTSEPSDRELSHQFRDLVVAPVLPRKPAQPGRLGRPLSLISNCYPLKFSGCHVYHYDLEVCRIGTNYTTPDTESASDASQYRDDHKKYRCLNTKLNRKVFNKLSSENFVGLFPVSDGESNVYCIKQLPIGNGKTFKVRMEAENPGEPGDPRGPRMDKFDVTIKPVVKKESGDNIINLEPLNALFRGQTTSVPLESVMVLETVLRYVPCLRFVPVGRNFFSPPKYQHPLGNGKEVWFGHHQSVRLAQTTPVVNLDISASSFYESIAVIQYVQKLLPGNIQLDRGYPLDKNQISRIEKDMKNICVETTHQPYRRKYHIDGLSKKSANEMKFKMTENNQVIETTVEKYYKARYRVTLKYPHLPCLKVKKKDSFLPMEVCEIVKGQHSNRELNPKQQAEMIKYTSNPPQQRFEEIEQTYKDCKYDQDPYLQTFGFRVLDRPLRVDGRTMETPNVLYKGASGEIRERPRLGTWNMMNKQFYKGTRINNWTLLSFANKDECHSGKLNQFASALHKYANEQGIQMNKCSHIKIAEAKLQSVRVYIDEMKTKLGAEMIFVVLPTDPRIPGKSEKLSQVLYSEVKRIAETNIGIVTQCVKGENVISRGTNASFVSNLCLKMNAKMGGVNNSMVPAEVSMLPEEPILFVGADVNHPAPTENTRYSLAAVVGNLDTHPSRYAVFVRAQKNEKNFKKMVEVILNMQEMMKSLLLAYFQATRKKPKKIIIYRDGVSDGQFSDVQSKEIKSIRDACTSLEAGYKPGITFIVVQKNHHVRFLPERRMDNPPPGTVIDTTVTHPLNFDFFLYSHKGLKGTSRPSYYTVLSDDNKFGFDALEKMTYSLCYTYVRCTKSISLPPPVQYADLAAYRARKHLNSHLTDLEVHGKIAKEDDGKFNIPIGEVQKIINVEDYMKDTMYYV